jgi:hypothetical protein
MVRDLYFQAEHFNVRYKSGALLNRVTAHDLSGLRPPDIEWVWIVGQKRYATPAEIRKLCGKST